MQSKTSSFNRGMWIQSMRNVGWIGALYTLILLFIVPLQIILRYTGEVNTCILASTAVRFTFTTDFHFHRQGRALYRETRHVI